MSIQALTQLRDTMTQLFQRQAALEAAVAEQQKQIERLQRAVQRPQKVAA